jgi:hypothetical protein
MKEFDKQKVIQNRQNQPMLLLPNKLFNRNLFGNTWFKNRDTKSELLISVIGHPA